MAWYDNSWSHRVKVTVDAADIGSNLSDYVVMVDLSNLPAGFHTNVRTDGGDIRVTEADGTTEVAREIVFYDDAADDGEIHFGPVSVDSVTDTDFYIYYGNAGASDYAVGATFGRNAVWANYEAVYHMQDDPSGTAPQMVDSTGNGHDGTSGGTMTTADVVTGNLPGNATDFDGNDDFVDIGTFDLGNTFAVEMWVEPDGQASVNTLFANAGSGGSTNGLKITINTFSTSDRKVIVATGNGSSGNNADTATGAITDNVWNHVVTKIARGSSSATILINGNDVTSDGTILSDFATNQNMHIAQMSDGNWEYDGAIDEVRIALNHPSDDFYSAQFSNHNIPLGFYTIGSQEDAPSGRERLMIL